MGFGTGSHATVETRRRDAPWIASHTGRGLEEQRTPGRRLPARAGGAVRPGQKASEAQAPPSPQTRTIHRTQLGARS